MTSDDGLALQAAKSDTRAFEAIYKRYHQDLYRFCLAIVGNPQDAQDALQNAMVKVLRALPGEKREIQLKPWLYRIAHNESVEVLRRRRDNDELKPEQAAVIGVAEAAEARERLRALLADLEQLPDRQRAALVMRELSGLSFDEIGTAFDSSAAVARQTLYEARLSLRQLEAGREMGCADVMRELSDADGRVTRRRQIRAHLRSCADCRAFREDIAKRHHDLAALAPLPIAASAGVLHGVLGQAGATGAGAVNSGGLAGTVGTGAGKAIATSALVKSAATVAVVAVAGVSAADRGGLIDVPLAGGSGHASAQSANQPYGSAGGGESASGAGAAAANPGATATPSPSSGTGASERSGEGSRMRDGSSRSENSAAGAKRSSSQAGLIPPGGGYGRSSSERHGHPEQPPPAADHGQQTAATHKPTGTSPPSGQGTSGGDRGKPAEGRGSPPAKSAPSPESHPQATPPVPQSPGEAPVREKGGSEEPETGATPSGDDG
jgi:RNA polymerase sigma factor (sigma-70 family)